MLMCDFGPNPDTVTAPGVMVGPLGIRPEMYKERPCVVVATTSGLTTIVPLSTSTPRVVRNFHHRIPAGRYACLDAHDDSWTKSDMVTTVSNVRLDRPFLAGRRSTVILTPADLKAVRATVLHALGLSFLTAGL